jgi:hypothetical protein
MSIINNNSVVIKQGKNLKTLNKTSLLGEAVRDNDKSVIEAQRSQMLSGTNINGKKITPKYRNEKYSAFKNQQNPLPGKGTPDLKLSGDLHKHLFIEVTEPNYIVGSDVDYFDEILEKYNSAFGLSNSNAEKVSAVSNDYFKSIHKALNK